MRGVLGRLRSRRNHFLSDVLPLDGCRDLGIHGLGRLQPEAHARGAPVDAADRRGMQVPRASAARRPLRSALAHQPLRRRVVRRRARDRARRRDPLAHGTETRVWARYVNGPGTPIKSQPIPDEVKDLFRAKQYAHSASAASIIGAGGAELPALIPATAIRGSRALLSRRPPDLPALRPSPPRRSRPRTPARAA